MTGGWGTPRKPVLDSIREYAADVRKRSREGTGLPPSDDPNRPPKGLASVSQPVANPERIQVTCYHCCGNHAGCTATTEESTDDH